MRHHDQNVGFQSHCIEALLTLLQAAEQRAADLAKSLTIVQSKAGNDENKLAKALEALTVAQNRERAKSAELEHMKTKHGACSRGGSLYDLTQ